MKVLTKKLKNTAGFTLSEVLVAVLILVMISATALPAALRAYQNAVDAANAQILLSTTVNALRDELSTAWDVKKSDDATITYKSSDTGDESVISVENNVIMLQEYNREDVPGWWDESSEKPKAEKRPLVSDAMRKTARDTGNNMTVVYEKASYDGAYVTIEGLTVKRGDSVLAKMPDGTNLLIRVMTKTENPVSRG